MPVVSVHYFGKADQVLSEEQTIRYVYRNFADLSHDRGVIAEEFPLWCHGYEWKVQLCPGGCSQSNPDKAFVSLYLICLSAKGGVEVQTKVEFRVSSANFSRQIFPHVFSSEDSAAWGWPDFVSREDILDPTKGFLVDGDLTVDVAIRVYRDKVPPGGRLENTLVMDMKNWLESAADTGDTKFTVGKKTLSAHVSILRARAPGLALLAEDHPSKTRILIPSSTTPAVFQALLKYIYCDELPDPEKFRKLAIELLTVADRFGCRGLKFAAEAKIIATGIKADTAADLILLGEAKNCALLKEAAMDFFVANSSSVMESKGWVNVTKSADLLKELLATIVTKNGARSVDAKNKREDYEKMRVSSLHELLKEKGLDIDGSKKVLIRRLNEAKNKITRAECSTGT